MNRKWQLVLRFSVMSLSVLTLALLAFGPARAADEIKVGLLSTGGDHWPIWVAEEKGFFEEQGLELRKFQTNSIAKAMQALSSNSTDVLFPSNTQGTITAHAKGAPIKIIAGNFSKALYELITGPQYEKVEDLKDTTFGVINLTSGSTVLLQKILAAHGLNYPGDYSLLTVGGTPARFAAVKKGAVSGAMVTVPTSFMARDEGLNVLANISTYLPEYQFTVISGNADWLEKNRDKAVRFLMALIKGMRYLNDPKNKDEVIEIMAERMKLSPKYAAMSYEQIVDDLKAVRNDAAPTNEALETVIKLEHDRGQLDKLYEPSTFIDDSYRQEALKRLGS